MTFEYEDRLVVYAQQYITGLLETKALKETVQPIWGNKSLDLDPDEYGLIVTKDKKRIAFTFTKAELVTGYGTERWAERLLSKTNEILKRLQR